MLMISRSTTSTFVALLEDSPSYQVAGLAITELSPEVLAQKQVADPHLADLRHYLLDGTVPKKKWPLPLDEFEIKEGVLYRLRHLLDRICYQFVVPASLKNSALKASHLPLLASHPGVQRTYDNARSMFYWTNMLKDCRDYVDNCSVSSQEVAPKECLWERLPWPSIL